MTDEYFAVLIDARADKVIRYRKIPKPRLPNNLQNILTEVGAVFLDVYIWKCLQNDNEPLADKEFMILYGTEPEKLNSEKINQYRVNFAREWLKTLRF
ncbi:MAG: hypothetical protein QXG39_10425 [Candidatus Aenigmatarchaeota archaeon]